MTVNLLIYSSITALLHLQLILQLIYSLLSPFTANLQLIYSYILTFTAPWHMAHALVWYDAAGLPAAVYLDYYYLIVIFIGYETLQYDQSY